VIQALNDLNQSAVTWDCGTLGVGVLVSDSLMFQRGDPTPSDAHMSHLYGLALPMLKRGIPITPVQLENLTVSNYLSGFRTLLLSYHGMKPLSPDVHAPLAAWVRNGGVLIVCDNDADPYNRVREWWNTEAFSFNTPREHLFAQLGLPPNPAPATTGLPMTRVGQGAVLWIREDPARFAESAEDEARLIAAIQPAFTWKETNYLMLRRGPYLIAAGLDESVAGEPRILRGRFINLFDPALRLQTSITIAPGSRWFLLDLDAAEAGPPRVLLSACKSLPATGAAGALSPTVEGVARTPAIVLCRMPEAPRKITLAGQPVDDFNYDAQEKLLWIRFRNESFPRELNVQ
jgi:hypothetical protein